MRDGLTYQGNNHREAIEQLFEINNILPNMCKGGSKFDVEDFHRNIVTQTLHEKARAEFIKRGGLTSATRTTSWTSQSKYKKELRGEWKLSTYSNKRCNNNNFKNNDDASSQNNNDDRNKN